MLYIVSRRGHVAELDADRMERRAGSGAYGGVEAP